MIRVAWHECPTFVEPWLAPVGSPPVRYRPRTMRAIAERVAAKYDLSLDELRGDGRHKYVSRPRQEAMWEMRQVRCADGSQRFSLPMIGQFFGDRDHTTVLHAVRAHERRQLKALVAA